jgi:hypothetical protein
VWRGDGGARGARYIVVLNTDSRPVAQVNLRNLAEALGGMAGARDQAKMRDLITGRTMYEGPLAEARVSLGGHEALILHLSY